MEQIKDATELELGKPISLIQYLGDLNGPDEGIETLANMMEVGQAVDVAVPMEDPNDGGYIMIRPWDCSVSLGTPRPGKPSVLIVDGHLAPGGCGSCRLEVPRNLWDKVTLTFH